MEDFGARVFLVVTIVLIEYFYSFYINLPIGGATAAAITLFLRIPAAPIPTAKTWLEILLQMDLPGSLAISAGLVCYLLALERGGLTANWSSSTVIGLLVGWILLSLVFVILEYVQQDRALVNTRFLKQRLILTCCLYIFWYDTLLFIHINYC